MKILFFLFIIINCFVFTQWLQNENATQITAGNLVVENVPTIPFDIKEKSRRYSNIRSASFRSWTQDGKGMLIATGFGETTQLHKVDRPLEQRKQITFYNETRVPVTESEQMRDKIKENGGEVWYMIAMDEGHGFRKKFNRDYFTNAMSLFWETHLIK